MYRFAISFLFLALVSVSYAVGYARGDTAVRQDVFKTCLAANMDPIICLNYMEIIKNKEYRLISGK